MADADFGDFEGGYGSSGNGEGAGRVQRLVNLAGAVSSVALVVGLAVWGYKLAVRDVSGVPVVRAMEGPMRVAPNDPGGTIADHQGLSVNDVAAVGAASPPPDRLVLAPRPVELSLEDTAGLAGAAALPEAGAEAALSEVSLATPPSPAAPPEVAPLEIAPLDEAALADPTALPEGMSATDAAVALALAEALETDALAASDAAPAPDGAITRSPRPQPRPGTAPVQEDPSVAVTSSPIDPATLEPGTRLVQLGAFDSALEAEEAWAGLQARFGPLLTGKSLVVQSAESGGSTFFRLRAAGFEDEDDARRLCASLMPDHDNCIPVTHR